MRCVVVACLYGVNNIHKQQQHHVHTYIHIYINMYISILYVCCIYVKEEKKILTTTRL